MRCLVTGASGLVGSRLTRRLVADGHAVRILVRSNSNTKPIDTLKLERDVGDLRNKDSLRKAVVGVDIVFHCAAKVSDWGKKRDYFEINVEGTHNLLMAAYAEGVQRFVHLSSCEVYGNPGKENIDEESELVFGQHPYTDSKIIGEQLVMGYYITGFPVVILRPATIWGPRSYNIFGEIARLIKNGDMIMINDGKAKARLCHVSNLVDAMLLAAEHKNAVGQIFNVSDGCGTTWKEIFDQIAAAIRIDKPGVSMPYWLTYILASGMEFYGKLLGVEQRPSATRMACRLTGIDQSFSITKIETKLGFSPRISFKEGLDDFKRWLQEEYILNRG